MAFTGVRFSSMASVTDTPLRIEVVWALPQAASRVVLTLPPGSTVGQAIHASGMLDRHPNIDLTRQTVGIFGELVRLDDLLRDGDRVEIYRPLIVDPAEVRRLRAAATARRRK